MSTRVTRGSTAKASATVVSDKENRTPQPSTSNLTADMKLPVRANEPAAASVEDDYVELPHNMGRVRRTRKAEVKAEAEVEVEAGIEKKAESEPKTPATKASAATPTAASGSRKRKAPKDATVDESEKPKKKTKAETYGIVQGETPFPDYLRPTPEECLEVRDILKKHHPNVQSRPDTIPEPSQIVAGCGEVPSILDALIRTRLSAATSGDNSSAAYQGMVARYGNKERGVGKGSVDYNAVRLASQQELFEAIKCGGLALVKSKDIKAILDMVHEENQERRRLHLKAKETQDDTKGPKGAHKQTEAQKDAEIALAEDDILTLDYYYNLDTYDAIFTFVKYPGIGVKTAACVALFCMQRPCIAVDTHVFRMTQYLGWIPSDNKKVGRDTTFSHLEVRVPDELKYDLHQLFIGHGKECPRCQAATSTKSAEWENANCPIEHLVKRLGQKKGGVDSPAQARKALKVAQKSAKGKKTAETASDDEDSQNPKEGESDFGESPSKPQARKPSVKKPRKAATKAKSKADITSDDADAPEDINDADFVSGTAPRKSSTRKKTPKKPARTPKKGKAAESDEADEEMPDADADEDEEVESPSKKPTKRAATKPKSKPKPKPTKAAVIKAPATEEVQPTTRRSSRRSLNKADS